MEVIYRSPLIRFGKLIGRLYRIGFSGYVLLTPYLLLCLRLRPMHPQGMALIVVGFTLVLIGAPLMALGIVLHNRWERRIQFVVVDYGVWIERVGRDSRLWRWGDIVRAIDVRKTRSIGLFLQKRALPITISGFDADLRRGFVEVINAQVRDHTDDYHNYLLTPAR